MSTNDLRAILRAPFTPEAVMWKVQTNPKQRQNGWGKGVAACFIDARLVSERLNHAVGDDGWQSAHRDLRQLQSGEGFAFSVECTLAVGKAAHSDVGYGSGKDPEVALKGAYSDALKRAAVHFGIGASLYAVPKQWLDVGQLKQMGNSFVMPRETEAQLRRNYAQWVMQPAVVERFGRPIDHGELLAAQAVPGPQNFPQEGKPAPNVERFRALARDAQATQRQVIDALDQAGVPPHEDLATRINTASGEHLDAAIEFLPGAPVGAQS